MKLKNLAVFVGTALTFSVFQAQATNDVHHCNFENGLAICAEKTSKGSVYHYIAANQGYMNQAGFMADRKCLEAKLQQDRIVEKYLDRMLTAAEYTVFYNKYPNKFEEKLISFLKTHHSETYENEIKYNKETIKSFAVGENKIKNLNTLVAVHQKTADGYQKQIDEKIEAKKKLKKNEKTKRSEIDKEIKNIEEQQKKSYEKINEIKTEISQIESQNEKDISINVMKLLPETISIINSSGQGEVYKGALFEKKVKEKTAYFTGLLQKESDKKQIAEMTDEFWKDYERNKIIASKKKEARLKEIEKEMSKIKETNQLNTMQTDGSFKPDPKLISLMNEVNEMNQAPGSKKVKVPDFKTQPVVLSISTIQLVEDNVIKTFYLEEKIKSEIEKKIANNENSFLYNLESGIIISRSCAPEQSVTKVKDDGHIEFVENYKIKEFSANLCGSTWSGVSAEIQKNKPFIAAACKKIK